MFSAKGLNRDLIKVLPEANNDRPKNVTRMGENQTL